MPTALTPFQQVAEALFRRIEGGSLPTFVAERREARPRWSWRLIADELATRTSDEIKLSGETLRLWYGEDAA